MALYPSWRKLRQKMLLLWWMVSGLDHGLYAQTGQQGNPQPKAMVTLKNIIHLKKHSCHQSCQFYNIFCPFEMLLLFKNNFWRDFHTKGLGIIMFKDLSIYENDKFEIHKELWIYLLKITACQILSCLMYYIPCHKIFTKRLSHPKWLLKDMFCLYKFGTLGVLAHI